MPQTAAPLVLTAEDRAELARWSQGRLPWLAERARIVLACGEPGSGVARVAAELGSTRMTVRKWRRRFAEDGLAALADHDRPGRPVAPLVLTGEERDQLTRWARRAKTSQALALRAKVVPACADGSSMWPACTTTRRSGRWCCAWMRSPASRRWTAPSRCCRCCPAPPGGAATTMSGTAPPTCSPRPASPAAP